MKAIAKNIIKRTLHSLGYRISKISKENTVLPKEAIPKKRPIGVMNLFLEDLSARGLVCNQILDIGANSGGWSWIAKRIFPDANIHLIEPQTEMLGRLEKFCSNCKNATFSLAGAGAKSGKLTLTVWDDLQGSSFTPQRSEQLVSSGKQREVDIITVDSLIETGKIKIPDLVKIDVQGFELEALRGAGQLFGKTEIFILEVSMFSFGNGTYPIFPEVTEFMFNRGYTVYDIAGYNRRPLDGALAQCDICFAKKDGILRASNKWALE